jgi:alpha-tubulin suppressor-like RCC1 family protein
MPVIRSFSLTLLCVFLVSALSAGAATVNATWNGASDVPVTAATYTATGNTVNFTLNFAPATGTNLTVVNNMGLPFISGAFDNLAQGQAVALSYGGVTYQYVAHYYGGTGNDLVLVWANQRLFGWGSNSFGMVGDGSYFVPRFTIVPVTVTQALAGKTLVALSQSGEHSMALCSDGTVLAWGLNNYGQLGNNTTTDSYVPLAVNVTNGISSLYGKNVVAIAAGSSCSVALCSDGTVSTWGYNSSGQLGNNTVTTRSAPGAVNTANGISALYGKSVVSIAAGNGHILALCADGTLVAWGDNTFGQLGSNSVGYNALPVAVNTAPGVSSLYGKSVVAFAAGGDHSLALCSDGSVSSWGNNFYGNLGNNTTTQSSVPVAVNTTSGISALYGKTLAAVSAAGYNNMGLCTDGSVVTWGYNIFGQLGNNSTTNSPVPVAVNTASGISALYGKTVRAIVTGGANHDNSTALCSDGTLTAWGDNSLGDLGNGGTTNSLVPVVLSTSPLGSGEKFVSPASSSTAANLVLVAEPIPTLTTLAATTGSTSAILNGTVNANNGTTVASFEYGTTTAYGSIIAATPNTVTGGGDTAVSSTITGLTPTTVYHYRLRAGGITGTDQTFTTLNNDASLASLTTSASSLNPVFAPVTTQYTVSVGSATDSIIITPTCADSNATARVNGTAVSSGSASGMISLGYGDNIITIAVTAQDGVTRQVYTLNVTRGIPVTLLANYLSAAYVPVSSNGFTATGHTIDFTLNFAPATGTNLTVVNNTGLPFVQGTFDNLAQGQAVALDYDGVTYHFVANYFGGSGNDLVLVWANNRALAWGDNTSGQIGDGTMTSRKLPTPVAILGVLAGKTVIAFTKGYSHALALCSDGTVAAWGSNDSGQLGDNTTMQRKVPVAVNTASGVSALYGKTVVSLAAGASHSMALCSDGTLVTWGGNTNGQLGNNSTTQSSVPVAVSTGSGVSALAGKTVMMIAANGLHNLALCTDGTLAAWGGNSSGQLGDNTTVQRKVPVAVNTASGISALYGKTVLGLTAGNYHNMVLCADGSLVTWGSNSFGQLGDNTTTQRNVPVAVNAVSGVSALAGKSVVAMAAGGQHNLALCTDGSVAAWGFNGSYQLGDGTATQRSVPVAVNAVSGVSSLYGRIVMSLSAGQNHSAALCSDGTLQTWGSNSTGALGDDTVPSLRNVPGPVSTSTLAAGEQWRILSNGTSGYDFNLAVAVAPPYATIATQSASDIAATSATLNSTVIAANDSMAVSFEYGTTSSYGTTVAAIPTPIISGTAIPASATITGLMPGTSYHFRVTGINSGSTLHGNDLTFTTPNNNADLSSLTASGGSLSPVFASDTLNYTLSVPYLTTSINIAGRPADLNASMQINGVSKPPGAINWTINLLEGSNTLSVLVTAQDGTTLKSYTLIVNRTSGPSLSSFGLDSGTLSPAFNSNTTSYTVNVSSDTSSIAVTPTVTDATTSVNVNGTTVASGSASNPVNLVYGDNTMTTKVTSQDGSTTKTYTMLVTRGIPTLFAASFATGSTIPLISHGLTATGSTVNLALNYAPVSGTTLTVVNNTSAGFINGAFSNLAQGQIVELNYNGIPYHFVANYFGGTGNDLILQWADCRAFAWGDDSSYQLGTQYSGDSIVTPTPVVVSDFLSQRKILSLVAGGTHSMALCSDGSIAAWGSINYGQLGVGSSVIQATTALGVSTSSGFSALHGKSVIAVAAGGNHSLALCSDGTVAAWGHNSYGQLGVDATIDQSAIPLAANTSYGVSSLNDKTVVAIAAGSAHSLALCSDGTVAAWGDNSFGQLGTGSTSASAIPVAVNTAAGVSALCGKTVVAISAGGNHSMALCSDGTLVTWGWNVFGQLGDNTTTNKFAPVAVKTANGVSALFGKTVVTMSAGGLHNLALCSDGTLVAWGANTVSQLGDTTKVTRLAPVKVYNVGALSAIFGKTVTNISAGASHSLAVCSDGTMAAWGDNSSGQLGSPLSITTQVRPVGVQRNLLATAELFASAVTGPNSSHGLVLVATPPATTASLAATAVTGFTVTLNGAVNASNGYVPVSFDIGLTTAYGTNLPGQPANVTGNSAQNTNVTLTGLQPATTYHFRANGGSYSGSDLTFTTAATGAMADAADFDNDGIPNLIEWACLLDPTTRNPLPITMVINGANFEYSYSRSTAAANSGAAFTVEWSDTLAAGSWSSTGVTQTVLSDDGTTQQVKAVIPINASLAKFARLSVTAP